MSIAKTAQSSANSGRTHKPMTHIIVERLKKMAVIWLAVYWDQFRRRRIAASSG